jgi:hypothetical protein
MPVIDFVSQCKCFAINFSARCKTYKNNSGHRDGPSASAENHLTNNTATNFQGNTEQVASNAVQFDQVYDANSTESDSELYDPIEELEDEIRTVTLKLKCLFEEERNDLLDLAYYCEKLGTRSWRILKIIANFNSDMLDDERERLRVVLFMENLVRQHDLKFIGPVHKLKALLAYSVTHSRTMMELLSHGSPFPSYTTVRHWFRQQPAIVGIDNVSNSDLVVAFDNNQVIGRQWRINASQGQPLSIVTCKIAVSISLPAIQFLHELDLGRVFSWREVPSDINLYSHIFRSAQARFIEHIIREVTSENMGNPDTTIIDYNYTMFARVGRGPERSLPRHERCSKQVKAFFLCTSQCIALPYRYILLLPCNLSPQPILRLTFSMNKTPRERTIGCPYICSPAM